MKRYKDLTDKQQDKIISDVYQQIVMLVATGVDKYVFDLDLEKQEDIEFLVWARQAILDTSSTMNTSHSEVYKQISERFHEQIVKLSLIVAEDSYYEENGDLIMEIFPNIIN